jgi:UDPglucose 6-dehydrogenase
VFDGRNIYDPEAVAAAGLSYEGIGRMSRGAGQ